MDAAVFHVVWFLVLQRCIENSDFTQSCYGDEKLPPKGALTGTYDYFLNFRTLKAGYFKSSAQIDYSTYQSRDE